MSSEMREVVKEMRAGTPCYVAKVGGGRCVNGAECLRCAERLDWADRLERALLARTEAGADHGAADHGMDRATKESLVPCDCGCGRSCCAFCGTDIGFVTHPHDASGDAERTKYEELIYAVGNKYPGETRHETALRFIRQAESHVGSEACAAIQAKEAK